MSFLLDLMNQEATYWGNPEPDGYGGKTFDRPVLINCRWEDKFELVVDRQGKEVTAISKVFVDRDMEVGGYIALGDFTGGSASTTTTTAGGYTPPSNANAYEILVVKKVPSLSADDSLRTIWLSRAT